MNSSAPVRIANFWSTAGWAVKLGGWSAAALTGIYLWPVLQKVGEDEGLFGTEADRFSPIIRWMAPVISSPVFWTSTGATIAAVVGFFYGRWLLGAMKEDGPDSRFRVTSPAELSLALSVHVLGHTYRLSRGETPRQQLMLPQSGYAEIMNRTAILLLRWLRGFDGRVLAVTSDRPAVGKTSTVIGLGKSLAEFGKRVLIIDCDLRNPGLHREVNLSNKIGFTDVAEANLDTSLVIRRVSALDLDVMTSGPLPPSPAGTVARWQAGDWMHSLLERYDYILIDTPPLGFAEVLQIIDIVDAFVYIVEHGSNLRAARILLDGLLKSSETPAAALMSKIPIRGSRSWGAGYDYAYDYSDGEPRLDEDTAVPSLTSCDSPAR